MRDRPAARGRPRDEQLTENALQSTLAILAEDGSETLTIEAVARRTRVSRTAIYKRWPSLADLVLDAAVRARDDLLAAHAPAVLTVPDTGTLAGDLSAYTRQGMALLDMLDRAGVTRLLLAESIRSPTLAARVRERLFVDDIRILDSVIQRAVERREAAPGQDVMAVLNALVGYLLHRKYTLHEELDDGGLERLSEILARGMRADPGTAGAASTQPADATPP